jgi:hypothetical protein
MTIIRKATRKKAKLRLGLSGASGSGKTMGSLLTAFGITGDWNKIGFIDTEAGSGELYVGARANTPEGAVEIGEYNYICIDQPFTVQKYLNAIKAFEAHGVEVIITDSLTHAWAGSGGLLEKQGKIADRLGNSYTAWREVTPDHNALVDAILQSPCHMICTVRAKTEYILETNEKGRQVPKKVGLAPVQREGMEYEFTAFFDIDQKNIAHASKDRTNIFIGEYFKLSPEVGKKLLAWINSGIDEYKTILDRMAAAQDQATLDKIKADLKPFWVSASQAEKDAITAAFKTKADSFKAGEQNND